MLKSSSTNCVHSKSISCTGKHNHVNTIWRQSHCRAHIMCWAGTPSVCGIPHISIMHLASGQCEKSASHRWTLTGHRLALHWPGTDWPYTDRALTGPTLTGHQRGPTLLSITSLLTNGSTPPREHLWRKSKPALRQAKWSARTPLATGSIYYICMYVRRYITCGNLAINTIIIHMLVTKST